MPPQEDGMKFESEGNEFGAPPQRGEGLDLTGRLIQWGMVSSRQEAQYVLLGIAVVALAVMAYLLSKSI